MSAKILTRFVFAASLALVCAGGAWAADPSIDQVYQAANAGDYGRAQAMMDQVLRDHPNSAKAHFVEAELLARQGKRAAARDEFGAAQRLDSSLAFAKPAAVQELKAMLSSGRATQQAAGMGVSWKPVLAAVLVFALILLFLRSRGRRGDPAVGDDYRPYPTPMGPAGPTGYGPGGAPMAGPGAGGMGSGILGGLATGAAVGAGMVAGEALMNRVLGEGRAAAVPQAFPDIDNARNDAGSYDMGGNDFGVNDAGSWDDGGGSSDDWN